MNTLSLCNEPPHEPTLMNLNLINLTLMNLYLMNLNLMNHPMNLPL